MCERDRPAEFLHQFAAERKAHAGAAVFGRIPEAEDALASANGKFRREI